MPKLLRPAYGTATFSNKPLKEKKSRKGLYIGAGLLGGAALVGGSLLARKKLPIPPSGGIPASKPTIPGGVHVQELHPKPINRLSNQLLSSAKKSRSNGQLLLPAAKTGEARGQLSLPAAKQNNIAKTASSSPLSLTKKRRNSALIQTRKKLYEPELKKLNQARSIKQNLDVNPGKYKSKRAGRYNTLRKQYDTAKQAIRNKYDNHW